MRFDRESVLVDENNNIVLRSKEVAKITTNKDVIIQGMVRFIGDGCVSFENGLSIRFGEITNIEIIK